MRARIRCRRWRRWRSRAHWSRRSRSDSPNRSTRANEGVLTATSRLDHRLMPTILLTGGTGYIGSHTCVELIGAGFDTVLLDNLCNSSPVVVDRIAAITGRRPAFIEGDIRDRATLDRVFGERPIDAVV